MRIFFAIMETATSIPLLVGIGEDGIGWYRPRAVYVEGTFHPWMSTTSVHNVCRLSPNALRPHMPSRHMSIPRSRKGKRMHMSLDRRILLTNSFRVDSSFFLSSHPGDQCKHRRSIGGYWVQAGPNAAGGDARRAGRNGVSHCLLGFIKAHVWGVMQNARSSRRAEGHTIQHALLRLATNRS